MTGIDQRAASDPTGLAGNSGADDQNWLRDIALGELLREAAHESGDHIALVDGTADPARRRRWTYRELLDQAEQVARALLARFRPGDRIALCSPNSAEWVILEYGTALAGMVLVPVNPAYRQAEISGLLEDSGAAALFHADGWRNNDIAASANAIGATTMPQLALFSFSRWDEFLASGANGIPLPKVDPRSPVIIQFTSGTTGRPKGAMLHHGLSNPPRSVARVCGLRKHGAWLNPMPMYHIGGAAVSLLATLSQHGTFVQMHEWDTAVALDLIESERCNATLQVPTTVLAMLDHPEFGKRDLSSLDFILTGGTPVPPVLLERVTRQIGCRMLISFGLSEGGGPVSNTFIGDGAYELAHTIGRVLPGVEVEVRDPQTGANLPVGTVGEMWLKGPQLMLGYYGREEETRAAITPDGWLRSGDLISMDERGYISIVGRLKDMIIRGGANVYPREVEDVLFDHPSVAQVAVIGIPDEKWGEVVFAIILPAEGFKLDFQDLGRHCRERLASYKVPAFWAEIAAFPLNATGKILKFELAAWVREGKLIPVGLRQDPVR